MTHVKNPHFLDSPTNSQPENEGFLKQNDSARLMELINSPPPIVPGSKSEKTFRLSLPSAA